MVNGSIPLLVQIMLAKTVAPLTEIECILFRHTVRPPGVGTKITAASLPCRCGTRATGQVPKKGRLLPSRVLHMRCSTNCEKVTGYEIQSQSVIKQLFPSKEMSL